MKESTIIDIKNKWFNLQEDEKYFRVSNANKILGDDITSKVMLANKLSQEEREKESFIAELRLDEYQGLLNPEGQDKMMTLKEFLNNNPNIPNEVIFKKLVSLKYVHKYNFIFRGKRVYWFAQQKPYTYLSIIPIYSSDINNITLDNNLAISNEAVKILQMECEQEYKKQMEEQSKKLEQKQRKIEEEKKINRLF